MKVSVVAQSSPFKQEMLSPSECYILDNGSDCKIFVWKGPSASTDERKAAMNAAEQFIREKNYPKQTQVTLQQTCLHTAAVHSHAKVMHHDSNLSTLPLLNCAKVLHYNNLSTSHHHSLSSVY